MNEVQVFHRETPPVKRPLVQRARHKQAEPWTASKHIAHVRYTHDCLACRNHHRSWVPRGFALRPYACRRLVAWVPTPAVPF
jgi:hypothetical protein